MNRLRCIRCPELLASYRHRPGSERRALKPLNILGSFCQKVIYSYPCYFDAAFNLERFPSAHRPNRVSRSVASSSLIANLRRNNARRSYRSKTMSADKRSSDHPLARPADRGGIYGSAPDRLAPRRSGSPATRIQAANVSTMVRASLSTSAARVGSANTDSVRACGACSARREPCFGRFSGRCWRVGLVPGQGKLCCPVHTF
jgi:hypothetical protein